MPRIKGGVNRLEKARGRRANEGVNVVSSTEPTTRIQPVAARERLLLAAAEAFAAKGFNATTTRDIANGAQMSSAAVYVHFRSKEELLFELSEAGHRIILGMIDEVDDPAVAPAERLATVVGAFTEHHAREHVRARVVNYELGSLAPDHLETVMELRREITRRVRAIVDAGIENGDFDVADSQATTNAMLSMGIDVARWYRAENSLPPEAMGKFYAELATRMVGLRDRD
ncbi:TetR/AcrR family transcriptional regulator [Gordonia rubripertincta]|uniref:TetR/AcrR family transcriptional regulator n=2 Tax=Gordonia rubripertincta TaxID=36822 RepID=A0AAW6R5E0_GORRU|nr:TetR/AcrR family transcriptional regulator [Gordonia rubripertincta]MDG6781044.1 TetR/AcrR family transcriptional regulator [Gordonia rubripertincta]GAB86214.1 putative TetR family transcriptional regulator [Gordonia rubripertincta NBRC 101908]